MFAANQVINHEALAIFSEVITKLQLITLVKIYGHFTKSLQGSLK